MKLRRAPDSHYADYLIEGMPRLSIQKSNHLNGQYVSSQVWVLHYIHDDGSTSVAGTFCYLRDIRSLMVSKDIVGWLQGKGFKI